MKETLSYINSPKPNLRELAFLFGRLGTTAFGGPAAHIAMMEEEVVRRRNWLSNEEFLDLLGATNLIPGPNSTEMAIHVGHRVGGWRGAIVAGISFIGPAFLIVWSIAWFYMKFGELLTFQSIFYSVKPVILAIISQAIWNLSRTAVKDWKLGVLAVFALGLYLTLGNEILILFLIALLNLFLRLNPQNPKNLVLFTFSAIFFSPVMKASAFVAEENKVSAEIIFIYFAKVGSILFGSGYVLIAFLQSDLVDKYHWINQQQLMDAIAVGQFTPGPVFTTATFVGYLISGNQGAMFATIGIFAPAFIFVGLSAPLIPVLRRKRWTAPLLDGLNVASLSLMVGAALILAKGTVNSAYDILLLVLSLALLIRFKINSAWLILATGLLGFIQSIK